jgi:hypothetical protein
MLNNPGVISLGYGFPEPENKPLRPSAVAMATNWTTQVTEHFLATTWHHLSNTKFGLNALGLLRGVRYASKRQQLATSQRLSKAFLTLQNPLSSIGLAICPRVNPEVLQYMDDTEHLGCYHNSHCRTKA